MSNNSMSKRIKNGLVQILQGITYDAGGGAEPAFVSVLDNTKDEFEGYPSARILPNQITSTSADTADFDHTVEYTVLVSWNFETSDIESQVYDRMYDITDLIMDFVEHGDYVGQLSKIDPSIQSWMMNVPLARTYLAQGKTGSILVSALTVKVTYTNNVAAAPLSSF